MNYRVEQKPLAEVEAAAAVWIVRRDGGLTAAEEREFGRWQTEDPRHAEAIARHDQAWSVLDRPRNAGMSAIMMRELSARASRRRRRRAIVGAGGVALLLLGCFVWLPPQPATAPSESAPVAVHGTVVLPETRTLPDGSTVELRRGAEVTIDFDGPFRRVVLQKGEAHFKVAKNKQRAFVVSAGGVEVRAVGTAFVVQLASKEVEVLVTEGRVAVAQAAAPAQPQGGTITEVDAGNRLVFPGTAGGDAPTVRPVAPVELAERLAWRAPRLELSGAPLSEAVALLNQYNEAKFIIGDPEIAGIQVSGIFRADHAETFVRMLEVSFGVKAERLNGTVVLRKAR